MSRHAEQAHGINRITFLPCGNTLIVAHLGNQAVRLYPSRVIDTGCHFAIVIPSAVSSCPILDVIEFTAHNAVIIVMINQAVHDITAVFGLVLGSFGFLVDYRLIFLIKDADGV